MRRVALIALPALVLSACGGARSRPAPGPTAANPPVERSAAPTTLDGARRAERDGRPGDALVFYERTAATSHDEHQRLIAQLGAVRLRLSADPALRDLRKAQVLLEAAEQTAATSTVPVTVSDLLQLLREAAELRAQLRAARAQVKSLEAEIAKKDDALRRVTSAVVGSRTP